MHHRPITLASLLLALLAGCTVGPNYQKPAVDTPAALRGGGQAGPSMAERPWKEFYGDRVLNGLIEEALRNNRDLVQATYRIEEARAAAGAARSEFFPWLDGSASASRARSSQETGPMGSAMNPYGNRFNLGAMLSYEVDLWGRIRRSNEGARARLLGSEYAQATVQITLVAAVASAYADLRTYDRQLEISQQTLEGRRKSLELMQERAKQGVSSDLEVGQAEVLLRQAEVAIPQTQQGIALKENELSLLMGRNPGPIGRGRTLEALDARARVAGGLPSRVLERRPDILAAEQDLIAANADIGVAKAAYFPALRLTGDAGLLSNDIDTLFEGTARTWSFAPSLAGPIFNAGRVRFGALASEARQKQSLAAYEKSIQTAFRETADALMSYGSTVQIVGKQEQLVAALRRVAELAATRYQGGASSYLEVLDAERNLFDGELALTEARRARLQSVVQAYRALGGGWSPK